MVRSRASMTKLVLSLVMLAVLGLAGAVSSASAGTANAGLATASRSDPLTGMPLGNYTGGQDEVFPAYFAATGETKRLLGLVALRPRMRWFGTFSYPTSPQESARDYIDNVTVGNPAVLSQMAVFRLVPWEYDACHRLPTAADQTDYRGWINQFAAGIGASRVALVLQPDLPFALCIPHRSQLPLQEVAYAARVFSSLPHTTVYLDVGASDWPTVGQASWILRHSGVRYTRGFALGATHYASNEAEIRYGAKLVASLRAKGIRGMHFVINTSQNGRPFTYAQYHGPDYDNAFVCARASSRRCVTLGIPPTTDVTNRRWGLSAKARRLARRLVDAYLWIGRPWLYRQDHPFDLQRTLALARTSPF